MGQPGPPSTNLAPPRTAKTTSSQKAARAQELLQDVRRRIKEFAARWDVRSVLQHGKNASRDACTGAARALLGLAGHLAALKAHTRTEIRHALSQEVDLHILLPVLLSNPDAAATCCTAVEQLARCLTGLIQQDGITAPLCKLINPASSNADTVQVASAAFLALLPQWRFSTFWSVWHATSGPQHLLECLQQWLPSSMQTWNQSSVVSATEHTNKLLKAGVTQGSAHGPAGAVGSTVQHGQLPGMAVQAAVEHLLQLQVAMARISSVVGEQMTATIESTKRWLWCLSGWLLLSCEENSPPSAMDLAQLITRLLLEQLSSCLWDHEDQPADVAVQLLHSLAQLLARVFEKGKWAGSIEAMPQHLLAAATNAMQLLSHPRVWCSACCAACHGMWSASHRQQFHKHMTAVAKTLPAVLSILQSQEQHTQASSGSSKHVSQQQGVEHAALRAPAGTPGSWSPETTRCMEAAVQLSTVIVSSANNVHVKFAGSQHTDTAVADMPCLMQPISQHQQCPATAAAAHHLRQAAQQLMQVVGAVTGRICHHGSGIPPARAGQDQSLETAVLCQRLVWLLAQHAPEAVLSYTAGVQSMTSPAALPLGLARSLALSSSCGTAAVQACQGPPTQQLQQHVLERQHASDVAAAGAQPTVSPVWMTCLKQAAKTFAQPQQRGGQIMVDGMWDMLQGVVIITPPAPDSNIAASCIQQLRALSTALSETSVACTHSSDQGHHAANNSPPKPAAGLADSPRSAASGAHGSPTPAMAGLLCVTVAVQQLLQLLAAKSHLPDDSQLPHALAAAAARHQLLVSVMRMSCTQVALGCLLQLAKSPSATDLQVLHHCIVSNEWANTAPTRLYDMPGCDAILSGSQCSGERVALDKDALHMMAALRDTLQQLIRMATCTCCAWSRTEPKHVVLASGSAAEGQPSWAASRNRASYEHRYQLDGNWQFPACPVHCSFHSTACNCGQTAATTGQLQRPAGATTTHLTAGSTAEDVACLLSVAKDGSSGEGLPSMQPASEIGNKKQPEALLLEMLQRQLWAELACLATSVLTSLFGQVGQPGTWLQLPCNTTSDCSRQDTGHDWQVPRSTGWIADMGSELQVDTVFGMHDGTQLQAHACLLASSPVLTSRLLAQMHTSHATQARCAEPQCHHPSSCHHCSSSSDVGCRMSAARQVIISLSAGVPSKEFGALLQLMHTGSCRVYTPASASRITGNEQPHSPAIVLARQEADVQPSSTGMQSKDLPDAAVMVKLARSLGLHDLAMLIKTTPAPSAPLLATHQHPCLLHLLPSCAIQLEPADQQHAHPRPGSDGPAAVADVSNGEAAITPCTSIQVTEPFLAGHSESAVPNHSAQQCVLTPQHPQVEDMLICNAALQEQLVGIHPLRTATIPTSDLPPLCDLLVAVPLAGPPHSAAGALPSVGVLGVHRAVLLASGGPVLSAACSSRWFNSTSNMHLAAMDLGGSQARSGPAGCEGSSSVCDVVTLPVVTPEITDLQAAWSLLSYVYTGRLYFHHCPVTSAVPGHDHTGSDTSPASAAGCSCCRHARTSLRLAYCSDALLMEGLGQLCRGALLAQLQEQHLPAVCLVTLMRDASLLGQAWAIDLLLLHLRLAATTCGKLPPADAVCDDKCTNRESKASWFSKLQQQPEWAALPGGLVSAATAACLQ